MDNVTKLKAGLITGITVITELTGMFGIVLIILLILFAFDYGTAMLAAVSTKSKTRNDSEKVKKGLKSSLGIKGILKKVGYMCLVGLACMVDAFLFATTDFIGVKLPFVLFFGTVVAIWLCINEMISILENIDRSGVDIPPWIGKVIQWLQINIDNKVEDALEKIGVTDEAEEKENEPPTN